MGPKKDNTKENKEKGGYGILEEQIKKVMELTNATNNSIENLKAAVQKTNNQLRKINENLTQLWVTAKEALTKATNNKQSIKDTKSELQKTNEKLTQLWVTTKEEALAKAISDEKSIQELKASNDFTHENIKYAT